MEGRRRFDEATDAEGQGRFGDGRGAFDEAAVVEWRRRYGGGRQARGGSGRLLGCEEVMGGEALGDNGVEIDEGTESRERCDGGARVQGDESAES